MTARAARTALLVATLVGPALDDVAAAEREHEVRSGESASSIAKTYYGDYELGDYVLQYNSRSETMIRARRSASARC